MSSAEIAVPRTRSAWLAPSLCDLFFVAVIAWSFMTPGTGWGRLLWDGDTAIHIATGNYILDHREIPSKDPFSFTKPDAAWSPWEWGTGVLFAELNRAFGLKGVAFVCGIVIVATITILLRTMLASGANMFLSLMLALMASNALSLHYHARPHLFTLFALALIVWINANTRFVWIIPAIIAIDANVHPGFMMLIAWLGAMTVGTALEWRAGTATRAAVIRYASILGASIAASLLNPWGFNLYTHALGGLTGQGVTELQQEWLAPTFRSSPQLYFLAFLLAGIACAGALLSRKKFAEPLLLFALAYASLTSLRHSTIFVIVAAPIVAREISAVWDAWVARQSRKSSACILDDLSRQRQASLNRSTPWAIVALAAIALWSPASVWPTGFDPELFPVKIVQNHPELATARVFTTDQWADFLLYANYPRQKVFFDDRQFYGPEMYRKVVDLLSGKPGATALLDEYRTDSVLIETKSPAASLLKADPRWQILDQDKTATLFTSRR
jgi:hypothetical protein